MVVCGRDHDGSAAVAYGLADSIGQLRGNDVAELAGDGSVRQNYPALSEAANEAASPQIRNLATIGGNMCQRPRCWYFRNGLGLMAKTADGKSMVVEGDNRYAAILGNSGPAYFVSPSTIAPMLIAYGAKIRLYSAKTAGSGVRELPLEKFFVIPKSENEMEHDLKPGEMVIVNGLQRVRPGSPVTPQTVAMGEQHIHPGSKTMYAQNAGDEQ